MAQGHERIGFSYSSSAAENCNEGPGETPEKVSESSSIGEKLAERVIVWADEEAKLVTKEIGDNLPGVERQMELIGHDGLDSFQAYFSIKILTEGYCSKDDPSVAALKVFEKALAEAINNTGLTSFEYVDVNQDALRREFESVCKQNDRTSKDRGLDEEGRGFLPLAQAIVKTCEHIKRVDSQEVNVLEVYQAIVNLMLNMVPVAVQCA